MKAWLNAAILVGMGFGLGFFAGERFGMKKAPKMPVETPQPEKDEVLDSQNIAKNEGYIPDDDEIDIDKQVEEVNAYLAEFEHPAEEDEPEEEPVYKASRIILDDHPTIGLVTGVDWENEEEFSRVSLTYYDEDEVVCDEDEQRIEDPEEILGPVALKSFGQNPMNPEDVIYVRNTWTETMYEVVRIHNAYGRVVLGLDEDYEFYKSTDE